jgi:DNA-binding NtrC family response regulator
LWLLHDSGADSWQHEAADVSIGLESRTELVGDDARMAAVRDAANRASVSDATVLSQGENGVGKTLLADFIHARSLRGHRRLVTIHCSAVPDSLVESELFGDTFHWAIGTTVLIDEVAELSLPQQDTLVQVLERIHRDLASSDVGPTGIRVMATATRRLPELIASGEFRDDLFNRLRIIELMLPPLRDRRGDIRVLAEHFAERLRPVTFAPAAMRALERYRWPGNVRELRNAVEQAVWRTDDEIIPFAALPEPVRAAADRLVLQQDRRSRVADELYEGLVGAGYSFWDHVHPLFLSRDITRHDLRELVRLGLANARGSYRGLLTLFGIESNDYKRFLSFLEAHDCVVDFRAFREPGDARVEPRASS